VFAGLCLLPANLLCDIYPWRTGDPKDLVPWNVLQFDGITQFYPWRLFAAQTWKSGFVPLWNPHQFCGTPFLANGQSAVLYPPNLLFVLLPVKLAFGWSDILHLIFTGVTAYLFFRQVGESSRWAATIGAACWQLSTWQISWITLPSFLDTSSWLPLALLTVHQLAKKPSVARASALGLVLALMLLAGHLQITFYCVLLIAAYAIYSIVQNRIPLGQWFKAAVVTTALTVLLTAAQLLPTIELSRNSPRSVSVVSSAGYNSYVNLAMPIEQVAGTFVPGFFGHPQLGTYWEKTPYPENACYVSVVGLLLAVIALFQLRQNKLIRFFAAVAAFALLIAIGTPLNAIFYYGIPGFAQTGSPARILLLWTFCVAFLAAEGADLVIAQVKSIWPAVATFGVLSSGLIGSVLLDLTHRDSGYLAFAENDLRLFAGLFLSSLAAIWLLLRKTVPASLSGPLLFAIVALDLLVVNFGYNPAASVGEVYPVTPSIAWLTAKSGEDRIMPVNSSWSITDPPNAVLPPNAATVFGLYDLQGYDSLQTRSYKEFANALDGQDSSPPENGNMLFANGIGTTEAREADAKYLISLTPLIGLGSPVITDGAAYVYEDQSARPLAGTVPISRPSATRLTVNGSGDFDIAEQWYPGWKALGPEQAKIAPSTIKPFIHITIGSARTTVLSFQPSSFFVGLYLSLVGILLSAFIFVKPRFAS